MNEFDNIPVESPIVNRKINPIAYIIASSLFLLFHEM